MRGLRSNAAAGVGKVPREIDRRYAGTFAMIGLFIDGSFLRKTWRQAAGARILRYDSLRALIERELNDRIGVAYWFDAQFPDSTGNDKHRAALLRAGFRVRAHYRVVTETVCDRNGDPIEDPHTRAPLTVFRQKGVDVGLARTLERSRECDGWRNLALAAGDADFAELVADLVEQHQVHASLIGIERSISLAFRPYAERIIDLNEYAGELAGLRSA